MCDCGCECPVTGELSDFIEVSDVSRISELEDELPQPFFDYCKDCRYCIMLEIVFRDE